MVCGTALSTRPKTRGGPLNSMPLKNLSDDIKWAVTNYKIMSGESSSPSKDIMINYQTVPSDVYHRQIMSSNNLNDIAYAIFPTSHHTDKANELKVLHKGGLLSDVAYNVLLQNELQKMLASNIIKKGGAIRIGSVIHHPAGTPGQALIPDASGDMIPFFVFTPTKSVEIPHGEQVVQKLSIIHPPRVSSLVKSVSTNSLPSTDGPMSMPRSLQASRTRGQSSKSPSDKGKSPVVTVPLEEMSWHVTTPSRSGEGGPSRIETISQYIQRHLQKGIIDQIDLPENYELDHGPIMTPEELQKYQREGYSDRGIEDIMHNKEQKRLAYDFIKEGGTVKFPFAAHHPVTTSPEEALGGKNLFKLAHIYHEPLTEQGRPNRLLHLYRWLPTSVLKPGSLSNLPHQRNQRKRPHDFSVILESSHEAPSSSQKSQRTL